MITIPTPIAEWLDSYSALTLVMTLIGVVILIKLVWSGLKKTFPSIKQAITFLESLARLPEFMISTEKVLTDQQATLELVKHEVLPNNGGSMRDEQTTMGLRMEKIEAKLSKDHEKFAEIEKQLAVRDATRISAAVLTPGGLNPRVVANSHFADSYNPYEVPEHPDCPDELLDN